MQSVQPSPSAAAAPSFLVGSLSCPVIDVKREQKASLALIFTRLFWWFVLP